MGADLYIQSIFQAQHAEYNPIFDEWVERRDALYKVGKEDEARAAQLMVEQFYDKMYERGYFRDSYNGSNLLHLFNLDWWGDVLELLDEDGRMSPEDTHGLLQMLADQENSFEINLKAQVPEEGETKEEIEAYFRDKYERLKAFLEEAIKLNEAIDCSI